MNDRRLLAAVLALALALRFAAVFMAGDRGLDHEWKTIVPNMLEGRGHSFFSVTGEGRISNHFQEDPQKVFPSAFMPVGYTAFLYSMLWLLGNSPLAVRAIELLQAIMGAAQCLLLYFIGARTFGRRAGMLGAAMLAVYPVHVYIGSQINAVSLYMLLDLAVVALLLRANEGGRARDYAIAGALTGLLILTRAQAQLLLPVLAIWVWLSSRTGGMRKAAVYLLMALLMLSPWLVRNYHAFGRPAPLTVSAGFNLWIGQNPGATGTISRLEGEPALKRRALLDAVELLPRERDFELRHDRLFMDAALDQMRDDPLRVLMLAARKFALYWVHFVSSDGVVPGASSPLYWLPWLMGLPFFMLGLCRSLGRHAPGLGLLYINLALPTLIVMVFFVLPRFRVFIVPFVLLFSAHGMLYLYERYYTGGDKAVSSRP